jgi:signal transduction histidine kinase
MSAGPQALPAQTQDQAVLGVLLHSLSQPLTSLRCSLELSAEDVAGQQQDAVSAALEQTDRVIAVVRLMREYLDTESAAAAQPPVPVGPVLRSVVDHLSPVAAERQVGLRLMGSCSSTIALPEPRLRLALQYLVGVLVEKQPRHGDITLRLEQRPLESELRAHVECEDCGANVLRYEPGVATLHDVQLAIARRLFESAGASLVFGGDDHSGFRLCIPRPPRSISPHFSRDIF